jgi:hypothetical protein
MGGVPKVGFCPPEQPDHLRVAGVGRSVTQCRQADPNHIGPVRWPGNIHAAPERDARQPVRQLVIEFFYWAAAGATSEGLLVPTGCEVGGAKADKLVRAGPARMA